MGMNIPSSIPSFPIMPEQRETKVTIPEKSDIQLDDKNDRDDQNRKLEQLVEDANKKFEVNGTELKFSIHANTNSIVVKVVDMKTKEVILEIPPEKMLDIMYNICVNMGVFIDKHG